MTPKLSILSDKMKRILAELESVLRDIETYEEPCNDNGDDFLTR